MPNELVERNEMLRKYAVDHPNATQEEIGKIFKISKARVNQILGLKQRDSVVLTTELEKV